MERRGDDAMRLMQHDNKNAAAAYPSAREPATGRLARTATTCGLSARPRADSCRGVLSAHTRASLCGAYLFDRPTRTSVLRHGRTQRAVEGELGISRRRAKGKEEQGGRGRQATAQAKEQGRWTEQREKSAERAIGGSRASIKRVSASTGSSAQKPKPTRKNDRRLGNASSRSFTIASRPAAA